MRNIFFNNTLKFEINIIGYAQKGESIVFFLMADSKPAYAGLVDCYEDDTGNEAIKLLLAAGRSHFDFVCWTHPHDDHTIGLDTLLKDYCDKDTVFWMSPVFSKNTDAYSQTVQHTYHNLFSVIESKKRRKMKIKTAIDSTRMDKCICSRLSGIGRYIFEIYSFAPSSEILTANVVKENEEKGNLYSIGLLINIGEFYIMLAGDVENRTFKTIPDYDLEFPIDYLKIPHHSSPSSGFLVDRLRELNIEAPNVATTTVFRKHRLPDKSVLAKYLSWGKKIEIYSTGSISVSGDGEKTGNIRTVFDVLHSEDDPIKTFLSGSAIKVDL